MAAYLLIYYSIIFIYDLKNQTIAIINILLASSFVDYPVDFPLFILTTYCIIDTIYCRNEFVFHKYNFLLNNKLNF